MSEQSTPKTEQTNTYWFYRWPLWLRIVLCVFLLPIFIPILVWPKLKMPIWGKIVILVIWIFVISNYSNSSSTAEKNKDIILNVSGVSQNEVKKDDKLDLKIKTDPLTVDEITINGEAVSKKGWNSEYSIEKTFPEGENKITIIAKKGDKKTEKVFNFKVDLSEKKLTEEAKKSETSISSSQTKEVVKKIDNKIPGLMPVDVYLNFEERGFKTEKNLGSEYSFWYSKDSSAGIDYNITTYTEGDVKSVVSVTATAMLNGKEKKDIIATLPFLQYISSLSYENSNPQEASKWVEDNFNNDKATTTINGVKYTIYVPTNMLRMLKIEKFIN